MEDKVILQIHRFVHSNRETITISKHKFKCTESAKGMRKVAINGFNFYEANPNNNNSKVAKYAKKGHKVTWISKNPFTKFGLVVDEKIITRNAAFADPEGEVEELESLSESEDEKKESEEEEVEEEDESNEESSDESDNTPSKKRKFSQACLLATPRSLNQLSDNDLNDLEDTLQHSIKLIQQERKRRNSLKKNSKK